MPSFDMMSQQEGESMEKIDLSNGLEMPSPGFGVFQSKPGQEAYQAVLWALEAGYRHVDPAQIYANEADVGKAIRDSSIPRESLFLTTKIWNANQGFEAACDSFEKSLSQAAVDYFDLLLIHWPQTHTRADTWKALEKLYEQGKCRSIGVSNYTSKHLQEMEGYASIKPMVNQVEFSPFLYQKELLDTCRSQGIVLEAYSPLAQAQKLSHPLLAELGSKFEASPAQIMIRWSMQKGAVPLPKSVKQGRIQENFDVFRFSLSADDMNLLDKLDEGFRTCWDPSSTE